jgi:hypothetical protein
VHTLHGNSDHTRPDEDIDKAWADSHRPLAPCWHQRRPSTALIAIREILPRIAPFDGEAHDARTPVTPKSGSMR